MVSSAPALAHSSPSGEKMTGPMQYFWPPSVHTADPSAVDQIRTVLSSLAETTRVPSVEKTVAVTGSVCAAMVRRQAPLKFHTLIIPSMLPETIFCPSGLKATDVTPL